MTIVKYPELFKKDSKGKTRVWYMERNVSDYRTIAGVHGGNLTTSNWTVCIGKQKRSHIEQAEFEIAAAYKDKSEGEYHYNIEDIDKGAHFYKPMLAHKYEKFPGPCYTQPKLDGIRCIINKEGMFSREGNPIYGAPHIFIKLSAVFDKYPDLVLDGELYNHDLKDDFNEISSIVRKQSPSFDELLKSEQIMQYHVYDMPSSTNVFGVRSAELQVKLGFLSQPCIVLVDTYEITAPGYLDEFNERFVADGYEGQMVRLNAEYEQKRSKNLLKRKEFQDAEYELLSIEEGKGNWAGAAKRVTCRMPNGDVFGAGIKGSYKRGVELLKEKHKVVTVRFFQLTPGGVPRFGVATKFHGDKRTL